MPEAKELYTKFTKAMKSHVFPNSARMVMAEVLELKFLIKGIRSALQAMQTYFITKHKKHCHSERIENNRA